MSAEPHYYTDAECPSCGTWRFRTTRRNDPAEDVWLCDSCEAVVDGVDWRDQVDKYRAHVDGLERVNVGLNEEVERLTFRLGVVESARDDWMRMHGEAHDREVAARAECDALRDLVGRAFVEGYLAAPSPYGDTDALAAWDASSARAAIEGADRPSDAGIHDYEDYVDGN